MQTAQQSNIVKVICWLDSCGPRRRTPVYALHCTAVGTSTFDSCSIMAVDCTLRYAHDSLRANYVSNLSVFYQRDLGMSRIGAITYVRETPHAALLLTSYMAFSREEQNKACVTIKQALALLSSHPRALVVPMRARLCCTEDPYTRALLARDIADFTRGSFPDNENRRRAQPYDYPAHPPPTERVRPFVQLPVG